MESEQEMTCVTYVPSPDSNQECCDYKVNNLNLKVTRTSQHTFISIYLTKIGMTYFLFDLQLIIFFYTISKKRQHIALILASQQESILIFRISGTSCLHITLSQTWDPSSVNVFQLCLYLFVCPCFDLNHSECIFPVLLSDLVCKASWINCVVFDVLCKV